MWPTRIDGLDAAQLAQLPRYRARWQGLPRETAPASRERAEAGVLRAYAAAGLAPPEQIVWCEGPIELAQRLAQEHATPTAGACVKSEIVEAVKERASVELQTRFDRALRARMLADLGLTVPSPVCRGITDAVSTAMAREYTRVSPLLSRLLARIKGRRQADWSVNHFRLLGFSRYSATWLALFQYVNEACDAEARGETRQLAGLIEVAECAGWMFPHATVCWLVEPCMTINVDNRGRLHARHGPALQCRDGWSMYAWKGVPLPARLIERAEDITPDHIAREFDPVIRRCMLDLMTPERFIRNGYATMVASDETGILWRKQWFDGDAWAAVEVINGTPEPDGTHKCYFLQVPPAMRTPREAVAWTYGLSEREYRGLRQRT